MAYPTDDQGQPLWGDDDGPATDYDNYVAWLSDYLATVTLAPAAHQQSLCAALCEDSPAQAMRRLGSDLGIDDAVAANEGYNEDDWEGADQDICEWPREVQMPIDVGYRVPLSLVFPPGNCCDGAHQIAGPLLPRLR